MIISMNQNMLSQLTCPATKSRVEYCSAETKGLLLEVRSSGAATWYLRYKVDSATKYVSFGPLSEVTLAQATKMALDMKAQIRAQGRDPRAEAKARKEMITLDDLWTNHYSVYAKPRKRSFDRDEQLWRIRIKGKFGHMRLNQITRQQIQTFHTELLEEGLAPASCDLHLKLCRFMYNCAKSWSLYDGVNPVSMVPLYSPDNKVQNILSEDELSRLMNVLRTDENKSAALIIQWQFATGMRIGATLAARWENLDRERRILVIPSSIAKSKKTSSIPLNDTAMEILGQLDTEGKFQNLFTNKQTGKPFTSLAHKTWDRIRKKAGLPNFRLHDARHTFASILANNNVAIYTISQLLNHSDTKVTSRYSHLSSKTLQDASNSASIIIKEAMQQKPQLVQQEQQKAQVDAV